MSEPDPLFHPGEVAIWQNQRGQLAHKNGHEVEVLSGMQLKMASQHDDAPGTPQKLTPVYRVQCSISVNKGYAAAWELRKKRPPGDVLGWEIGDLLPITAGVDYTEQVLVVSQMHRKLVTTP
jgi:hypothetical protein